MAELKDDFDFNTLDPDRWENLCFALVHAKNPLVRTVNGHGGDEGIDAYVGSFGEPVEIYQFKFCRISQREIEDHLKEWSGRFAPAAE